MVVNSTKDFSVGMILKDSWRGNAYFFEVVSISPKSIQVVKLLTEFCDPDDPEDDDDCLRFFHLITDKNGNFIPEGKAKRKFLKPTKDGKLQLSSISWKVNGSIGELKNPHDKMVLYLW